MSTTYTYKCDIKGCSNEFENSNKLLHLKIDITGTEDFIFADGKRLLYVSKDICPACAEKIGITRKIIEKDAVKNEVKSTADQLYDILCQITWENTQH